MQKPFNNQATVSVLGAGAWGTALAITLAKNAHRVLLWGRDTAHVNAMRIHKENQAYLPGISLPSNLLLTDDIELACRDAEILLITVPSRAIIDLLHKIKPFISSRTKIAWASKGMAGEPGQFLDKIIEHTLGARPLGLISGPSFAH